ncbi:hypothetical protein M8818_004109 [Zalaria obscura]|uniref:Uncharacterized protein n=1 Tax=Zalaria obscura TaxID=2024903 RepID=A0ACC3SDV8_9PEZI
MKSKVHPQHNEGHFNTAGRTLCLERTTHRPTPNRETKARRESTTNQDPGAQCHDPAQLRRPHLPGAQWQDLPRCQDNGGYGRPQAWRICADEETVHVQADEEQVVQDGDGSVASEAWMVYGRFVGLHYDFGLHTLVSYRSGFHSLCVESI